MPAPMLNGSASRAPVAVRTLPAVAIIADLIVAGDQFGRLPRISAATPAMCGDAIDVPDSGPNVPPPFGPGARAATMSTPGAAMSGLTRSPPLVRSGPREENPATTGTGVGGRPVWSPTSSAIVGFGVAM